MLTDNLFKGKWVYLDGVNLDLDPALEAVWSAQPDYAKNFNKPFLRPLIEREIRQYYEKTLKRTDEAEDYFHFAVRACIDSRLIGFVRLQQIYWSHRNAQLVSGMGEVDNLRDYTEEALRLALAYAFRELNLHSVTASALDCEAERIECLNRVGFVQRVNQRGAGYSEGDYCDLLLFSILRSEWQAGGQQ